jgi:hypothetical protein
MTMGHEPGSDPVVIHVFGGRKGETIVLRLPDGHWGIVDCYASSLSDPTTNPAYVLLKKEGVQSLAFLCLTHPHDDHYRGMSQLLDHFPVKAFWSFCDTFPDDFQLIVRYFEAELNDLGGSPEIRFKADKLRGIFEGIVGTGRVPISAARSNQQLYPVPTGIGDPLEIRAIAPTHHVAREYVRSLLRFLRGRARNDLSVRPFPHHHHNAVSIALLVSYGRARIILGGDVEETGWRAVLAEFTPEFLAAGVVKVSHHGSTTGYCEGLWSRMGVGKRSLAVLTPYSRHRLPEVAALEEISRHTRAVYSSCGQGHCQAVRDWHSRHLSSRRMENFRAKAQAALQGDRGQASDRIEGYAREAFRKLNQPRQPEAEIFGHCEIRAFPDGRCEVVPHGDAVALTGSD